MDTRRWWPNSILDSVISRETFTCTQLSIDLSFCPSQFCFCHPTVFSKTTSLAKKLTVQPFRCLRSSSEAFTTAGSFVRDSRPQNWYRMMSTHHQCFSIAFWHDQVTCWTYQDNSPDKEACGNFFQYLCRGKFGENTTEIASWVPRVISIFTLCTDEWYNQFPWRDPISSVDRHLIFLNVAYPPFWGGHGCKNNQDCNIWAAISNNCSWGSW